MPVSNYNNKTILRRLSAFGGAALLTAGLCSAGHSSPLHRQVHSKIKHSELQTKTLPMRPKLPSTNVVGISATSAVAEKNSNTSIVFAVVPDAKGGDGIRNVLFRLSKAVVQQTGQVVTVEISEGQTNRQLPLLPQASGSASEWLSKLKQYVPSLTWSSDRGAIHVFLPASRPYDPDGRFIATSHSYDPLSRTIPVDYCATLTVDQWYTWLLSQVPRSRLYIDESGYGTSPNIGYNTGLSDQKVHLTVTKGATIRQFLTNLTLGFGGSWTADIYGPLEPIKKAGQTKTVILRQLNIVYLFRPSDPFS